MLLFLLAALAPDPITAEEVAAGVAQAAAVRAGFNAEMLDYPTARFRDVHVAVNTGVEGDRGSYFCGFVNGKNRMGAYVGWTEFSASASSDGEPLVVIRSVSGDEPMDGLVDAMCGSNASRDPVDRSGLLTYR